jgi:hypothetical protein
MGQEIGSSNMKNNEIMILWDTQKVALSLLAEEFVRRE